MNFVFLFLFYLVGISVCSFGVISPLIVIRTAIPITRHLLNQKLMYPHLAKEANRRSAFTICFWIVLDIIVITLLILFATLYMQIGFAIGFVVALVSGIGKTGPTTNNIADYASSYRDCLPTVYAEEIVKELYIYQQCYYSNFLK